MTRWSDGGEAMAGTYGAVARQDEAYGACACPARPQRERGVRSECMCAGAGAVHVAAGDRVWEHARLCAQPRALSRSGACVTLRAGLRP